MWPLGLRFGLSIFISRVLFFGRIFAFDFSDISLYTVAVD